MIELEERTIIYDEYRRTLNALQLAPRDPALLAVKAALAWVLNRDVTPPAQRFWPRIADAPAKEPPTPSDGSAET